MLAGIFMLKFKCPSEKLNRLTGCIDIIPAPNQPNPVVLQEIPFSPSYGSIFPSVRALKINPVEATKTI